MKIVLILFLFLLDSLFASDLFQINKVERKLINPAQTLETALLFNSTVKSGYENSMLIGINYAVDNRIEIVPIGANYLFYNGFDDEYLAGLRFVGMSSGSDTGSSTAFELRLEGKDTIADSIFALKYHALYTYIYNTKNSIDDGYIGELLFEPIYAINDTFSFSFISRYVRSKDNVYTELEHFNIGGNLSININKYIELYLGYTYFENTSRDKKSLYYNEPVFNPYGYDFTHSYGNRLSVGTAIRFFL